MKNERETKKQFKDSDHSRFMPTKKVDINAENQKETLEEGEVNKGDKDKNLRE